MASKLTGEVAARAKVNHHTERGTETRRYLPERHEAAWNKRVTAHKQRREW